MDSDNPIVNSDNNSKSYEKLEFFSNFDEDRMLSIFDNLSSLDLFKLESLKKIMKCLVIIQKCLMVINIDCTLIPYT